MAVSMMYLRFLILIPVFSVEIFLSVYPYLLIMSFVSVIIAWIIHKKTDFTELTKDTEDDGEESNNPLEFKVALIFALLFVVFTVVTHYTFSYAGAEGLNILSFVSGLSDVTPFVLTLLQGTGSLAVSMAVACTLQAIVSNNLMKMCYALFFSGRRKEMLPYLTIGFTLIIVLNVALLIFFYLH
jgi:Predicted membrane protein